METTAKVLETMRSAGLPFCYFKFRVKLEFENYKIMNDYCSP